MPLRPPAIDARLRGLLLATAVGTAVLIAITADRGRDAPPVVASRPSTPSGRPAPSIAPSPDVAPSPPPRRTTPRLDSACVLGALGDGPVPSTCTWEDDGFPAISSDGTLVVVDDRGVITPRESWERTILVLDVESSRIVGGYSIVVDEDAAPFQDRDPSTSVLAAALERARVRGRVAERVHALDAFLDHRGFRTLESFDDPRGEMHDRVVVPAPPSAPIAPDDPMPCTSWHLQEMVLWRDAATRTVLAAMTYRTGGCTCDVAPAYRIVGG